MSAGSMDADAALPAPAPQPQDVSMWQAQDDSMDGAAALPSQPNEVIDLTDYKPGTISEINRMDNAAFALLYIQWLVYGEDRHMYDVDDWPLQVHELRAHCSLSSDLGSLNAALSELVIYPPYLWCKAAYWHELKESITPMWKRAGLISEAGLISGGLIPKAFEGKLKWMWCLNFYAVKNSLACNFVVKEYSLACSQKFKGEPRLIYQAHGRYPSSRYNQVNKKGRLAENDLRHQLACSSNSDSQPFITRRRR